MMDQELERPRVNFPGWDQCFGSVELIHTVGLATWRTASL